MLMPPKHRVDHQKISLPPSPPHQPRRLATLVQQLVLTAPSLALRELGADPVAPFVEIVGVRRALRTLRQRAGGALCQPGGLFLGLSELYSC